MIQEMGAPVFKKEIDDMIFNGICYGTSALKRCMKDIAVMEEIKRINREIAQAFRIPDELLHKEFMEQGPEKFTGLEDMFKEKT